MAEFLTTKGIAHKLEDIITKAKKQIVLVSPYLKISQQFFERLQTADKANISITLVFGKEGKLDIERYSEFKNLSIYYYEHLHGKCYYNERILLITSMNLHEYSERNNREFGVLIDSAMDKDVYSDTIEEINSIVSLADKVESGNEAYCIRCRTAIDYDPSKSLCDECYETWSDYGNADYPESYCHCCGNEVPEISYAYPECYSCYKSNNTPW